MSSNVAGTATTTTLTGLALGQAYRAAVAASNGLGDGPAAVSNEVLLGLPSAPTKVTAAGGPASVIVSWDAPTSGRASLIEYQLTASSGQQVRVLDGAATKGVVTGLTNGQPYTFTVRARNALGWGPSSISSDPGTPDEMPGWLFPLECAYLIVLLALVAAYAVLPGLRAVLPATVASVPLAIPWFGALGAVMIGLYGVFDHNHKDWTSRYNAWHIARPLSGAVLGMMAYLIFIATIKAAGVDPTGQPAAGSLPTDQIAYFVIAFAAGYREESFRVLFKRAVDLLLGPGQSPQA